MLFRFSLYGFLKNQRYFEPFLMLFFLDKGLSFSQIGLLIGFRELMLNLVEIPSGAFADSYGRRGSMIFSFIAYIISFTIFAFTTSYLLFFAAMLFYAVGDGFRTGTHKSMIFTWLRIEGRKNEKTQVYGFTRSWSKTGSAVSILIGAVILFFTENYSLLFGLAIIPYVLGVINFLGYPKALDGEKNSNSESIAGTLRTLWDALKQVVQKKQLRRLIAESMGFEGVFKSLKDYIQPVIENMALLFPLFVAYDDVRRNAVLVGIVYFILYAASAWASRNSYLLAKWAGGDKAGTKIIWRIALGIYLAFIPLLYFEINTGAVALFVILFIIQNFWRPMLISRFDDCSKEEQGATILSIESQSKAVTAMIAAPLLGLAVDAVKTSGLGGSFWPLGVLGLVVSGIMLLTEKHFVNNSSNGDNKSTAHAD